MSIKAKVTFTEKANGLFGRTYTYNGVREIRGGRAIEVMGRDDCDGNGVKYNAPLTVLYFEDGNQATFEADHIVITFEA